MSCLSDVCSCKVEARKISCKVELEKLSKVFAKLENSLILGGGNFASKQNTYSYFAAQPIEIFQLENSDTNHFEKIQAAINKYKLTSANNSELPSGIFACGWAGYFSYDLGRAVEDVPQIAVNDLEMPFVRLCFYDKVICYDHKKEVFWLLAAEFDGASEKAREKISSLETILQSSLREKTDVQFASLDISRKPIEKFSVNMSQDDYFDALAKIKKYIYDGDVYQINFSQRFCYDFAGAAIDLYLWQNKFNPSPFAAFIDSDDFQIVSASPELFIKTDGRKIVTRPIKGTRPRGNDADKNVRMRNELIANEKEKAELDMIIDLERNDFGRICEYGSIEVSQRRKIEDYATVMHAVADVKGVLREEINFSDLLKAVFPGGSITGAPKVSAMGIIEQLEPTQRGLYTGSIGYISLDENVCLNIAIRTIIIKGSKAFAQAGGGIVADSQPRAEWDESLDKAKALLEGIEANYLNADSADDTDFRKQKDGDGTKSFF
ncbi:MAG: aminodeoxychorismate synthase component I [Anaerohalosphaeraceae bacterium]|nr:aminodeoxychorismate synthase component I [Anaerohalosphaeraceae bacterium]